MALLCLADAHSIREPAARGASPITPPDDVFVLKVKKFPPFSLS
jgi:hypothetical protein